MELSRSCIPYTPLKRDLKDCRVGLVTTSGGYVDGMEPFADSDLRFYLIPTETDTSRIRFAPGHFDTSNGALDPNIMFPLDRLKDILGAGEIGKIAEYHVSMGLTMELRKLKEQVSWDIAQAVVKTRPDIVVLTGG